MPTADLSRRASLWKWGTVGLCLAVGLLYFVAGWLGGDQWFAVWGLVVMVVFAGVILLAGRYSETVSGLLSRRDERINAIDATATNFACMVVLAALLVGFISELVHGDDGMPYSMLLALGGVAYLLAVVVLRLRK